MKVLTLYRAYFEFNFRGSTHMTHWDTYGECRGDVKREAIAKAFRMSFDYDSVRLTSIRKRFGRQSFEDQIPFTFQRIYIPNAPEVKSPLQGITFEGVSRPGENVTLFSLV